MCYQNRLHATINQAGFRNMLHMVIDIDKTIVMVTQKCYVLFCLSYINKLYSHTTTDITYV
jgi:hypothetical protein